MGKHTAMRHMHKHEQQADMKHMTESTAGRHDKYAEQTNSKQT